ncbi:MAG: hypothetical protein CMP49_05865 [Flavobacteriales bacterium]|nr:hypothetical protein [Flavobacteriales bacterium]
MNKLYQISFAFLFLFNFVFSQEKMLPKNFSFEEFNLMDKYLSNLSISQDVITVPPNFSVRTMAEWEEIQALTIAWEGYEPILTEIVRNSVDQCKVIIACENPSQVENYLMNNNVETSNVEYLNISTNSIWMRDYGQNTIYENDVDSLYLVDWIYNRPRPDDDTFPESLADYLNLNLYQTSVNPYRLVATGGNFMTDGFGTAFSSNLILDENDGSGDYNSLNYPNQSEQDIDEIMNSFMGIETYIKMPELPYDAIHHIDMHMKLLDEETLLVAEYPEGMSDGPQIEENLEYILNNYTTKWGTPFKVVRIPSPPSTSGAYPGSQPNNQIDGYYRTYTNSVFVNKTVIVPFYREEYDTIAQRIYEEALPGYNIVGIDCDNSGNNIISLSGAIHCITHSVGVNEPLLISYKKIEDICPNTPYVPLQAMVQHKSGISEVYFKYRYAGDVEFNSVNMQQDQVDGLWNMVMTFDELAEIEYYIHAIANNGKEQFRPMTALDGGYNSFIYDYNQCDEFECVAQIDSDCFFSSTWDPVCGCNGVTYSNLEEAECNNIFVFTDGPCNDTVDLEFLDLDDDNLIKIIDVMGRNVINPQKGQVLFFIFNNGVIQKKLIH